MIGGAGEEGNSDDAAPPGGGSESGSEGAGSGKEDEEWRGALEAAKRQLGARGAGLSPAEQEKLDAMEAQEQRAAGGEAEARGPEDGGMRAVPRKLRFTCSMLQREVTWRREGDGVPRRRWETMRCRVWNRDAGRWEGGDTIRLRFLLVSAVS